MGSYPVEIRRCQHIRVNGRQCGSPALKEKEFCYYHERNRPEAARLYIDGERYADSEMMLPPFEDAHSIQMVLRQVLQLLFERRIERKDAGLALYALQIASGNLKQMQAEKPRPTQVVVEPEKVAETPMGMTPWSVSGEGHDPEDRGGAENGEWRERFMGRLREQTARILRMKKWLEENRDSTYRKARGMLWAELRSWANETIACFDNYDLEELGNEVLPLEEMPAIASSAEEERLQGEVKCWEERAAELAASLRDWLGQDLNLEELKHNLEGLAEQAERDVKEGADDDPLPPETIQACAESAGYVV